MSLRYATSGPQEERKMSLAIVAVLYEAFTFLSAAANYRVAKSTFQYYVKRGGPPPTSARKTALHSSEEQIVCNLLLQYPRRAGLSPFSIFVILCSFKSSLSRLRAKTKLLLKKGAPGLKYVRLFKSPHYEKQRYA